MPFRLTRFRADGERLFLLKDSVLLAIEDKLRGKPALFESRKFVGIGMFFPGHKRNSLLDKACEKLRTTALSVKYHDWLAGHFACPFLP